MIFKANVKDYITTIAFAAVPVILTYQAEIGRYVPMEYALIFTIGMGLLSQLAANKRVEIAQATTDVKGVIVETNTLIDEKQAQIEMLQSELDKYQELATVTALEALDTAPVEGA
jgi:hypothetical protein